MKYKFICPIFRIEIRLAIGGKPIGIENCFSAACDTIFKDDGVLDHIIVWVESPDSYNDMVHETIHLTKRIFGLAGIPFNETNDEIIAYYQNYWVRIFWNKMSKNIKEDNENNN